MWFKTKNVQEWMKIDADESQGDNKWRVTDEKSMKRDRGNWLNVNIWFKSVEFKNE